MAKIDVNDVAYVGTQNVVDFFRFLIENNLDAGAIQHLASLGVVDIMISQQAVDETKRYISSTLASKGVLSAQAENVVQCICCNNGCRNH